MKGERVAQLELLLRSHPEGLRRAEIARRLGVHRSEDGRDAVLEVADQGKGLPAAERERVMRPFERGESARSGVTGSGLGLAIVDRIVRRSGGSVELGDASPHGLLVRVRFPLAPKAELKKSMKAQEKAARETER